MKDVPNPDRWQGITWYAYAEVYQPDSPETSTRPERLSRDPEATFTDPIDVADWIEDMTRRHAQRRTVHLIGGGIAKTGDEGQRQRDFERDLEVLYRGDSVYVDFHRGIDRMHLWVEAVRDEDQEVRTE